MVMTLLLKQEIIIKPIKKNKTRSRESYENLPEYLS